MNEKKGFTRKNVVFTIVSLFLLVVLIEVILSVVLYHKYGNEKLAIIEVGKIARNMFRRPVSSVNVEIQNLVRPDSSEAVNRQIAEEIQQSNKFKYESWIEFQNIDFDGRYVNIANAVRLSEPSVAAGSGSDTLLIYFFGGSTTFGFNVSDSETLPSQFVQLYQQKYRSQPIRVVNLGCPTYYSYQELIYFANLIFQGHRPDIVIFLDGVNDFWFARASYYNQSYFSYILRQVFNQELLASGDFYFRDSAAYMYRDPTNIPLEQYNNTLIRNYQSNIGNIKMLADLIGAKSFFFCQPVPFYKYPKQASDPICFKDKNTRYDYIYPIIEKNAHTWPNFTFLGNMLEDESGYPFVDGLHYSPSFTRKVAERILSVVMASGGTADSLSLVR